MVKGFFNLFKKNEEVVVKANNLIEEELVVTSVETKNEEITLENLMGDLSKWRGKFIQLKQTLNDKLKKLDKEEKMLKNKLAYDDLSDNEISLIEAHLEENKNMKKIIIEQKAMIKKLDCDGELTYNMIGKKINNYKYYTEQLHA